jgi:hypothetical protein
MLAALGQPRLQCKVLCVSLLLHRCDTTRIRNGLDQFEFQPWNQTRARLLWRLGGYTASRATPVRRAPQPDTAGLLLSPEGRERMAIERERRRTATPRANSSADLPESSVLVDVLAAQVATQV